MPKLKRTSFDKTTLKKPTTNLIIEYGFPIFMVSWDNIKYMIFASYALNAIVIIFSICLLYAALKISTNIAVFINMITAYDGSSLPACLYVASFLGLINSSLLIYAIQKSYKKNKNKHLNKMFFVLIITCLVISIIMIAFGIFAYLREVTLNDRVYDGIIEGMYKYKNDSYIKKKIDTLQLTFQCCGSRDYNDWFNISWYQSPLQTYMENEGKDETPFSCCSMHSAFPCIHHDIMSVGTSYLYAPESNLSISEYGCMPILICYTKLLTWRTAICFFILGLLLIIIASLARLIQSAHIEFYKFHRSCCYWYTSWLFGRYIGKNSKKPPTPPPFP